MEKIIKRVGNSIGIIFDVDDKRIYGLKKGKVIKFTIEEVRELKCQNH